MRWATTPDEIRHHHDVTAMVTLNQINAIKRDDGSVFIGLVVGAHSERSTDGLSFRGRFDIDAVDGMHYSLDVQDIEAANNVDAQHRADFINRGIISEIEL